LDLPEHDELSVWTGFLQRQLRHAQVTPRPAHTFRAQGSSVAGFDSLSRRKPKEVCRSEGHVHVRGDLGFTGSFTQANISQPYDSIKDFPPLALRSIPPVGQVRRSATGARLGGHPNGARFPKSVPPPPRFPSPGLYRASAATRSLRKPALSQAGLLDHARRKSASRRSPSILLQAITNPFGASAPG
jgi:hypothetical protein